MSWVDGVVVLALGIGVWRGAMQGVLRKLFTWGGFLAGLIVVGVIAPAILDATSPTGPTARLVVAFTVFIALSVIVEIGFALLGRRLHRRIAGTELGNLDRGAGAVLTALFALAATWLLATAFAAGPVPLLARGIGSSAIVRFIDSWAQVPRAFAVLARHLDHTPFPQVFVELNPSLAPEVDPAPESLARDLDVVRVSEFTYRIDVTGCGGVTGTGFAVRPGLVLTAAHVVAGSEEVSVAVPRRREPLAATVVHLDTAKDIAVLRVDRLPRTTLPFVSTPAERGDLLASVGYGRGRTPGIVGGRVRSRGAAIGRDVYARRLVTREIYVLRAALEPGDSGGPVVDDAGRVRAMVFAGAPDRSEEGYALVTTELAPALAAARTRTEPVPTGECAL